MNGRWKYIEEHINSTQDVNYCFTDINSLSGGCINKAWKASDTKNNKSWFIKENSPSLQHMFEAEALGLIEIQRSNSIRVPKPICFGTVKDFSYLVLEFITLSSSVNQAETGRQLADMHKTTQSSFGWKKDNTIGSTPQKNIKNKDWVSFWKEQRLIYQLNLAQKNGYTNIAYENGLKLAENLETFFKTYHPLPSLLHGDLWGGNCATDSRNNPIIFDPAVYYGDRETDIAMTELFGGFSNQFYSAYNNEYPLDQDYKTRKNLYNLYHILNHFNLFGGGYSSQASSITEQLLSEFH